jgi:hypothetical protein
MLRAIAFGLVGYLIGGLIIRVARADGERALTPFCCTAFSSMRYRPGNASRRLPGPI